MIQQIRGKWDFLEGIGGLLGQYANLREEKRVKQKGEAENAADRLFKLAEVGALPEGLDGTATQALQLAGIQPDALFSYSKRKKQDLEAEANRRRLALEQLQSQVEENRAQADAARALARQRDEVKPPVTNVKAAEDAVEPFAAARIPFEEALPQMRSLPTFQGISDGVLKVYYTAAKRKLEEQAARKNVGSGTGQKPMAAPTQLNYWQDLTRDAVQAAFQRLTQTPGFLQQEQDDQDSALLSLAIDFVNKNQDPRIREQFSKGLGLAHFQAALLGVRKANQPKAEKETPAERMAKLLNPPPQGATATPAGKPRAATVDDVRAAIAALKTTDEAKIRQWLVQRGLTPPE